MTEEIITLHVDAALKAAFSEAAKATDRTDSQALQDLMQDFVDRHDQRSDYDVWLRKKIATARAEITAGNLQSHAGVEACFAAQRRG